MVLGAAAGQPGSTAPVTISFTIQTALTSAGNGQITILWPNKYLSPIDNATFTVSYSGPANTFVPNAVGTQSSVTIAVGIAGAPAGAYTITLNAAVISPNPWLSKGCIDGSRDNCVFVSTTNDLMGLASYPAILPRGQVQAVSVSILDSDRFTSESGTLTISFTTQTDLGSGGDQVTL